VKNTRKLCFYCCHPCSERDLICQKCGAHDISGKSVYHIIVVVLIVIGVEISFIYFRLGRDVFRFF
jgi:hypothetical protein